MHRYVEISVFLFGLLALIVPSGYSVGAFLLFLGSFSLFWLRHADGAGSNSRSEREKADHWIIFSFLFFSITWIFSTTLDGQGWSGVDKPSRFLFAIPALLLMLRFSFRADFLWSGIAFGSILTGSWTLWQKLFEGQSRAGGFTHLIQFGNISLLMGILCFAGLGWAFVQPHKKRWLPLLGLGGMLGLLGSMLSGSRGGWLGFPIFLILLYVSYGAEASRRAIFAAMVFLLLFSSAVYFIPQTGVQHRLNQAVSEVQRYIERGDERSSVGARFEMWRVGGVLFLEKPLLGWGHQGMIAEKNRLIAEGEASPRIQRYGHLHSEFIDVLAKRGMLGFLALILLYGTPLFLLVKFLRHPDLHLRAFALSGVLLPVAYIDFGLTQAFLLHNSGVMVYAFLMVILWAGFRNRQKVLGTKW
jgi:O-antigen ligase